MATDEEVRAAELIQSEILRTIGKSLPILSKSQVITDRVNHISVKADGLADNRSVTRCGDEVRVRARPGGLLGAAVAYLEGIGVNRYAPDSLWHSDTSSPDIWSVVDDDSPPDVEVFYEDGANVYENDAWFDQVGAKRRGVVRPAHTWNLFLMIQSFIDHLNIQPTYDGEDWVPNEEEIASSANWQPCMFYTCDLADAMEPGCRAYLDQHGGGFLPVSVNDGGNFCGCPECVAADSAAGSFTRNRTNQYHRLLNELAARLKDDYPNLVVFGLKYYATNESPEVDLDEHIAIQQMGTLTGGADRPLLAVYDHMHGQKQLIPLICTDALKTRAAMAKSDGLLAWTMEGHPSFGHMLAQPWIMAKLAWDLDEDIDALWSQWASDMFGDAAGDVLDYVSALNDLLASYDEWPPFRRLHDQIGRVTAAQLAIVASADSALSLAESTPDLTDRQTARLGQIRSAWHVTKTLMTWAASDNEPSAAAVAAFRDWIDTRIIGHYTTLAHYSHDGARLNEWLDSAITFATVKPARWSGWDNVLHRVDGANPVNLTQLNNPLPSRWLVEWTVERGEAPARNRFSLTDGGLRSWLWIGHNGDPNSFYIWNGSEFICEVSINAYGDPLNIMFVYDPDDAWRLLIDGHQVASGGSSDISPVARSWFRVTTLGTEASTDAVFRTTA